MNFDYAFYWEEEENGHVLLKTYPQYYPLVFTLSREEAIDLSIEKWEGILKKRKELGRNLDGGSWESVESCPLCAKFGNDDCVNCPIYEYVGYPYCHYTPFGSAAQNPTVKNLQAEIEFLKEMRNHYSNLEREDN
jgi:hypothetical protein